ncbi:MAG: N-acetyltransferase [Herbinix sp.]|jgi:ribosomal-protein-alanine N-acetyltransferase|nr:N-acetyltransferase [Herbinix sp.]
MQHKGTKTIEMVRLKLRKFEMSDSQDMFQNWANDPEVCRYLSWAPYGSLTAVQLKMKEWVEDYYSDTYRWAIELNSTRQVIGSISIFGADDKKQACEVGYCIGTAWWGQGIMTEALRAVLHYMFYEVGFHRIQAVHDSRNVASGRVMQKVGMQYEGILRHATISRDGIYVDYVVYAKLSTDL